MKRFVVAGIAAASLALASTTAAALVPGVFDPGNTGCVTATYAGGVLHLEKNCPTSTNAAAGADITGLEGQTFTSASFTLDEREPVPGRLAALQRRHDHRVVLPRLQQRDPDDQRRRVGDLHLHGGDDRGGGNQVPFPTGTITALDVLIDVEGTADITNITVNGELQVPTVQTAKDQCKDGGWQSFTIAVVQEPGRLRQLLRHRRNQPRQRVALGAEGERRRSPSSP